MNESSPNDLIQTVYGSLLDLLDGGIKFLPALLLAIIIIALTIYLVGTVRRIAKAMSEKFLDNRSLQSLMVQIAVVATWASDILLACIVIFPELGLGDIIGLLGLSSVAIGFAFKDIAQNFLAGILLLLNEPFQLNDQILVEDFEGTVEAINIRSTEIRTHQGERIVIPNSVVFTSAVRVLTDLPHRRTDLAIGLDYNTPLERARQVLLMALPDVDGVLSTPAPEVDLVGFGDSSIDFVVRYWTKPQKVHVRQIQSQVIIALKKACDEADFNIPYPIRTLYYFNQEKFNDHYTKDAIANANGSSANR